MQGEFFELFDAGRRRREAEEETQNTEMRGKEKGKKGKGSNGVCVHLTLYRLLSLSRSALATRREGEKLWE